MNKPKETSRVATNAPISITKLKAVAITRKTNKDDKGDNAKIRFASLPLRRERKALVPPNQVEKEKQQKPVEVKKVKEFQIKKITEKAPIVDPKLAPIPARSNPSVAKELTRSNKVNLRPRIDKNSTPVSKPGINATCSSAQVKSCQSFSQTGPREQNVQNSRRLDNSPKFEKKASKKRIKRIKTAERILAPSHIQYTFSLKQGNNHQMIERIITNRSWWKRAPPPSKKTVPGQKGPPIQFYWWMICRDAHFKKLENDSDSYLMKKSCNRLSHASEIADKDNLFRNLWFHSQLSQTNVFNIVPLTFSFRMQEKQFAEDIQAFARFFIATQKGIPLDEVQPISLVNDPETQTDLPIYYDFPVKFKPTITIPRKFQNPDCHTIDKNPCFFAGKNIWIIKPSGCDRGKGVEIFKSLEELSYFLKLYVSGYNMSEYTKMNYTDQDTVSPSMKEGAIPNQDARKTCITKFVIQKYMELPALYRGHKFDIRAHALLTQNMELFIFRNSFVRICSLPYTLDSNNYFAHLTNTSVNMKSNSFNKLAIGNQMSITDLAAFFDEVEANNPNNKIKNFEEYLFAEVSRLAKQAFDACLSKKNLLNPNEIPNSFELIGFDVMVDANYKCWLIETNFVPGLTDEDNPYLKSFLDRMMDDLFKLTLDEMYPMPRNGTKAIQNFPLLNFPNEENLWKFVCKY